MRRFIPQFVFSIYHYLLAFLGAVFYGFPGKKLIVIGVTGTNGKSTVVHLATEVFDKLDFKVASFSSIRFKIGDREELNMLKMTMPGRFKLQKFLKEAVQAKCQYVFLEVTSEGIKQFRHKFIDFDGIVFTNLTREHIEAHNGFENYKKAKGKLFKALAKSKKNNKFAIFNADDKNSKYYAKLAGDVKKGFYKKNPNIKIQLQGEFNKYNASAVVEVIKILGLSTEKALGALKEIKKIPGRMELVIDKDFKVFVDYAHTPDSLTKVYQTIRKSEIPASSAGGRNPKSEMICVLGSCGGGRDKWKRPEMGEIAAKYCNQIILTNEDPYNENPSHILSEIEHGISNLSAYGRSPRLAGRRAAERQILKMLDRKEAIARAMSLAKKGDVVIITGKGCEPWMCVAGGKKLKWDDRKIVREKYKEMVA